MNNRRHFLQTVAFGAATTFLSRPSAANSLRADRPSQSSVVVLGAGLAGLAAARTLQSAGRRVLVLEASTALGGQARGVSGLDWSPDTLGRGVDVRFGAQAHQLVLRGRQVVIETATGPVTAAGVVVALPPAVVASGQLVIDALSTRQRRAFDALAAVTPRWKSGSKAAPRTRHVAPLAQCDGPIVFAGDRTIVQGFQTADGAVRSGVRAAGMVG